MRLGRGQYLSGYLSINQRIDLVFLVIAGGLDGRILIGISNAYHSHIQVLLKTENGGDAVLF